MFYHQFQFLSNVEGVVLSVYTVNLVDIPDFVDSKKELILCTDSVILPAVDLLFSAVLEKGVQFTLNIKPVYIIIFV